LSNRYVKLSWHCDKLTVAFRNKTVVTSRRSTLSLENAFTVQFRL